VDADGVLVAAALGVQGSVSVSRYAKSKWSNWINLGNSSVTHVSMVRQPQHLLFVARNARGGIQALWVDTELKAVAEWVQIGSGCAGQPTAMFSPRSDVHILYRDSSGAAMEIRQTGAGFAQAQQIASPPLTSDPCAALTASGNMLMVASSRAGLIAKQMAGGVWHDAGGFSQAPKGARSFALFMIEADKLIVTARTAAGNFLTKTEHTAWTDTGVREPDASLLVRLRTGKTDLVSLSWLAAVISSMAGAFRLTIDALDPVPPLFEGDTVEVTYTLINGSPKVATGAATAVLSSNSPTWYSYTMKETGPSPVGLAAGASLESTFKTGDYQYLAAGVANISVRYVSYQTPPKLVRLSFYGPGLGPVVALGGVIDYIAADTRQEKVWSFEEPFPTDDATVAPGPAVCSTGSPDLAAPVNSYNFVTLCRTVQGIDEPRTINEVAAIVQQAAIAGTRLRVLGSEHSANAQICTEGRAVRMSALQGCAPANSGMTLLWQPSIDYDADLSWPDGASAPQNPPQILQFEGQTAVQVGPGMKIRDLNNWLDANGLSLGFAVPGFRDPTVGGAVATGTHGSSILHSVVLSSRVKWLLVVRPDGAIVEYSESTTDSDTWKALRCNLGFLGVIVQLRLLVEPAFNLRVKVSWTTADELLAASSPQDLLKGCDWGQMVWFPSAGSGDAPVAVFQGHKTSDEADLSVDNRLLHPTIPVAEDTLASWVIDGMKSSVCSGTGGSFWEVLRADVAKYVYPPYTGADQIRGFAKLLVDLPPAMSSTLMGLILAIPGIFPILGPLLPILGIVAATTDPCEPELVGRWHRMMSSELAKTRPMQRDWEVFVPASRAKDVLNAASQFFKTNDIYLPLIGIFLRFAPAEDTTLIAHTVALPGSTTVGEPGMFFEMPVLLPENMKCSDRDQYEALFSSFIDNLIINYGARAHWGKNRGSTFQLERKLAVYGFNLTRFRNVVKRIDPTGMFANQYGVDLGLRWPASTPIPSNTEDRGCIPG
jgi:FAD/FMN-containing dehydrogenase